MPVNNALTPEGQNSLGAAFGYFPQLRRNRTVQDPRLAAEMPLQFLRGRTAATLGAPSDILNFLRSPLPMEVAGDVDYAQQVQVPYGSQELLKTLPLPPQGPAQAAAANVGAVVPLTPAEALAAARAARQAALATGRMLGPAAERMAADYLQRQGLMPGVLPVEASAFQYPQEEAMRLAQQRAALPVEQGGLGLPAGNTAEQRAAAMGFDPNNPMYHATDVDFQSIRPSSAGKMGAGVYVSPSSKYAEKYAGEGARVLPLVTRGQLASDDVAMDIAESIRQKMAAQNPDFSVPEWKRQTTQAIEDAGYAGRNFSGLESVITNPENIRSRFAAFDPFRRNAAIAAATGALAPDLLAAQAEQDAYSKNELRKFKRQSAR